MSITIYTDGSCQTQTGIGGYAAILQCAEHRREVAGRAENRTNYYGVLERSGFFHPYKIHTVLTDNGVEFANQATYKYAFKLLFDHICDEYGIEHRFTKPSHLWTNGQVERMNRLLKEATVQCYFYETLQELLEHLNTYLAAINFAKRLRNLKGLMELSRQNGVCKCL